ncbi:MAG: ABC transporter substrate-binding protein [Desulfohalobiaceae bacterium]|nr:ABC transporter substrate-binding protein [Desulfohalobiaceae bacterium]
MRRLMNLILSILLVCALGLLPATAAAAKDARIKMGTINWPGVTVKTEIAKQILETLGYQVQTMELQVAPTLKAVSNGQLDVFLGCWLPNQITYMKGYLEEGTITKLGQNLDQTIYCHAVPQYVWDAGVHSLADLDKPEFRDKFDLNGDGKPELYGIESGNVGNKNTLEAIDKDIYGLGDWDFVSSSTAGMLSQVKKAAKNKDWIVFQGWKPHWMVIEWDLKFLKDPKEIWEGQGRNTSVWTIIHSGFDEKHPNVTRFLEQIRVLPEWQSQWIYDFTYKNEEPEKVARRWIGNNMDIVAMWTYGVTSVDGENARKVLREEFK